MNTEKLESLFTPLTKEIPKGSREIFHIPKWELIAPTYGEAVERVFAEIKKTRSFYNWQEGRLGPKFLKETQRKKDMLEKCEQSDDGRFYIVEVQLCQKYIGKSVKEVRTLFDSNEFGLGAFEVGCILLVKPDILKSSDDLWIDCAGDEFSPDEGESFLRSPYFYFYDGGVRFVTRDVDDAYGRYGAASGFLPQ